MLAWCWAFAHSDTRTDMGWKLSPRQLGIATWETPPRVHPQSDPVGRPVATRDEASLRAQEQRSGVGAAQRQGSRTF